VRSHGRASWVGVVGDTVTVFDGNRVQFFSRAGAYLGHARALDDVLKGALFFSKRIRPTSEGVLVDVEQRRGASRSLAPQVRHGRVVSRDIGRVVTLGAGDLTGRGAG
jgi:hypothetical protein